MSGRGATSGQLGGPTPESHPTRRMFNAPHQLLPGRGHAPATATELAGGAGIKALYPVTLKVMLSRDETAYLFGHDGILLGQLRQQTGATIALTDPQSFEHILAIGGAIDVIFKAFSLVCRKLWDFLMSIIGPNASKPLIIRLAVPASQCGTIIGKHGAKVKELRELSGAYIQVSQESLPESTERVVEISGTGESCVQCTYHLCSLLQEAPVRGEVMPYIPTLQPGSGPSHRDGGRPGANAWRPVVLCGPRAYLIEAETARPCPPELLRLALNNGQNAATYASSDQSLNHSSREDSLLRPAYMNPEVLLQAITNAPLNQTQTSEEMAIASHFVGVIVGPDGQKRSEIRQISGAQIHIDEQAPFNSQGERIITISGTKESITLAKFLIQSTIDLTMNPKGQSFPPGPGNNIGAPPSALPGHLTALGQPNPESYQDTNYPVEYPSQAEGSVGRLGGKGVRDPRRTDRDAKYSGNSSFSRNGAGFRGHRR